MREAIIVTGYVATLLVIFMVVYGIVMLRVG